MHLKIKKNDKQEYYKKQHRCVMVLGTIFIKKQSRSYYSDVYLSLMFSYNKIGQ